MAAISDVDVIPVIRACTQSFIHYQAPTTYHSLCELEDIGMYKASSPRLVGKLTNNRAEKWAITHCDMGWEGRGPGLVGWGSVSPGEDHWAAQFAQ